MTLLFGSPFDWVSFAVWAIVTYTVFLGLYIPVWRSQWWKVWEGRKHQAYTGRLTGRGGTPAMRHLLFYPPLWLNGPLWALVFTLSAISITVLLKKGRESDGGGGGGGVSDDSSSPLLLEVAVLLWIVQIWMHGIWTIYFFYWALPLWSILHLMVAGVLAIAYASVAAVVALSSLWFYLPFLILTWTVALSNLVIYLAYTNPIVVGNPMAMWWKRGFNPVPWPVYYYERVYAERG